MSGRTRISLIVVGMAIAAGGGSAHAAPTWLAPIPLGESGSPDVAMNGHGDAAVVWGMHGANAFHGKVLATVRPAGGSFGATQTLSDPNHQGGVGGPDVVIDAQGNAIAAWVLADNFEGANSRIQWAFRPAGGTFGPAQTIFSPGGDPPFLDPVHLAVDPQGNAIAVWHRTDFAFVRIQASFRPAGGSFGAPQTISEPGTGARNPRIAMDAQGNALAVWELSDGSHSRVHAAFRPVGGTFGAPQTISAAGEDAFRGNVALDPQGNAISIWKGVGACNPGPCTEHVLASFRPAGGAFGAPFEVSGPSQGCDCPEPPPGIGFDAQGNAVAAWVQDPGNANSRAQAAFRPAGGGFGSAQELGQAGSGQEGLSLAVDAQGGALAVWPRLDQSLQGAFRPAGGTFGAAAQVSGAEVGAAQATVAIDAQGNGIAGWTDPPPSPNAGAGLVFVAGFDGAGPRLDGLTFPAAAVAGSLAPFLVSPLDVWSGVASTSWAFGDGGSAVGSDVSYAYARAGTFTASVTATDTLGNSSTAQHDVAVTARGGPRALTRFTVPKSIRRAKLVKRGLPVIVYNALRNSTDDISLLAKAGDLRSATLLKTIGRTVRRGQRAGKRKIRVKPTRKFARRLRFRGRKTLTVRVKIVVTAPGARKTTVTKSVTVKR
jgi:hypothetical protein